MTKSEFNECLRAADLLVDDPSRADSGVEGVFTEIDVLILAIGHKRISFKAQQSYQRWANQVLGDLWRDGELVRFGPVEPPGIPADYLRIASKIAYATEDGPDSVWTPNGRFPQVIQTVDPIKRRGRRTGTNRDDLTSWDQQEYSPVKVPTKNKLMEELAQAQARIRELEAS